MNTPYALRPTPLTVIFFGLSGAGKGTQATLLQKKLQAQGRTVFYVETGERFRQFINKENYTTKLVKEVMASGGLLPAFLPIWIWTGLFIDSLTGGEDIIMDGLARRPEEAPILDSALKFYQRSRPNILFLHTSPDWARDRLLARGRYDDTHVNITRRHAWFDSDVKPVLDYFRKAEGYQFHTINGEQTIEEVHEEIIRALKLGSRL